MSKYDEMTERIRDVYTRASAWPRAAADDFDQWLAAIRAEERANALYDAARAWAEDPDAWGDNEKDYRNELRDRADRELMGT